MDAVEPRRGATDEATRDEPRQFRASCNRQAPNPDQEARWAAWQEENASAIAAWNAWYEAKGHPLAAYMTLPDGAV